MLDSGCLWLRNRCNGRKPQHPFKHMGIPYYSGNGIDIHCHTKGAHQWEGLSFWKDWTVVWKEQIPYLIQTFEPAESMQMETSFSMMELKTRWYSKNKTACGIRLKDVLMSLRYKHGRYAHHSRMMGQATGSRCVTWKVRILLPTTKRNWLWSNTTTGKNKPNEATSVLLL